MTVVFPGMEKSSSWLYSFTLSAVGFMRVRYSNEQTPTKKFGSSHYQEPGTRLA
jgi:hypothetical protein